MCCRSISSDKRSRGEQVVVVCFQDGIEIRRSLELYRIAAVGFEDIVDDAVAIGLTAIEIESFACGSIVDTVVKEVGMINTVVEVNRAVV